MPISDIIKPISGEHSIKEAVITIFLANAIEDPSSFADLVENKFKGSFNKVDFFNETQFQFGPKNSEISSVKNTPKVGFRFLKESEGKITRVLQGKNEQERAFFAFHTLDYDRWNPFLEDFISTIAVIGDIHGEIMAKAYSLHYIDQFLWTSDEQLDFKIIFNENSKLLPHEFFSSRNNAYSWLKEKKAGEFEYFDHLNIKIDDSLDTPLITISHNAVRRLHETLNISELIKKEEFRLLLNHAHDYNKEVLGELLEPEVQILIKLHK